jgi:hypothetical protein
VPKRPITADQQLRRLRCSAVLADQATEPITVQNPDAGIRSGRNRMPGRRPLMQRPMRPMRVVMIGVLAEDQPQLPLVGDQHPVQALAAGAGDPPFGDRVGPHRQRRPVPMIGIDVCG